MKSVCCQPWVRVPSPPILWVLCLISPSFSLLLLPPSVFNLQREPLPVLWWKLHTDFYFWSSWTFRVIHIAVPDSAPQASQALLILHDPSSALQPEWSQSPVFQGHCFFYLLFKSTVERELLAPTLQLVSSWFLWCFLFIGSLWLALFSRFPLGLCSLASSLSIFKIVDLKFCLLSPVSGTVQFTFSYVWIILSYF